MRRPIHTVIDSFLAFVDHFGIVLYSHQREDFSEAGCRRDGRFVHRVAGISWPRGDGKSYAGAAFGLWRLLTGRAGTDIVSVALDFEGARVVLDHARSIVRERPELDRVIDVKASALHVRSTNSRWTIESREHTATRGRHPDLIIYDECGWARDDALFASLLAGQASVDDPLMLVISTVGRRKTGPLWTVKQLAESGDAAILWRWRGENRSPRVTQQFLERQRRILVPAQFAREHQNQWVDAADALTTQADVDAAMDHGPVVTPPDARPVAFVDLGTVHDPSVIAVGYRAVSRFVIAELHTFQGSREEPVKIADVERKIRQLDAIWNLRKIRIESWQGVAAAQSLTAVGLPVELFTPTAKTNAEEWPLLVQHLTTRTLDLPKNVRLREELLNLVVEMTPNGVRVIDRGKVHQDHAVAVRGVVAMLVAQAQSREVEISASWANWMSQHSSDDDESEMASGVRCDKSEVDGGDRWSALGGLTPRQRV